MKPRMSVSRGGGFTQVELIVVAFSLAAILSLLVAGLPRAKAKAQRISCRNQLSSMGTAYRVWAGDNSDKMPFEVPAAQGGWKAVFEQTNAAALLWTNYVTMGNELGQEPRILLCPADERAVLTNFSQAKDNSFISYFLGAQAQAGDSLPQSLLAGDRNLAPGLEPKDDYGYSSSDNKGNDVRLQTNSPVCWSLKMHSAGRVDGAGNVLLGDGSVQQASSLGLREDVIIRGGVAPTRAISDAAATNAPAQPPVIRLLFP